MERAILKVEPGAERTREAAESAMKDGAEELWAWSDGTPASPLEDADGAFPPTFPGVGLEVSHAGRTGKLVLFATGRKGWKAVVAASREASAANPARVTLARLNGILKEMDAKGETAVWFPPEDGLDLAAVREAAERAKAAMDAIARADAAKSKPGAVTKARARADAAKEAASETATELEAARREQASAFSKAMADEGADASEDPDAEKARREIARDVERLTAKLARRTKRARERASEADYAEREASEADATRAEAEAVLEENSPEKGAERAAKALKAIRSVLTRQKWLNDGPGASPGERFLAYGKPERDGKKEWKTAVEAALAAAAEEGRTALCVGTDGIAFASKAPEGFHADGAEIVAEDSETARIAVEAAARAVNAGGKGRAIAFRDAEGRAFAVSLTDDAAEDLPPSAGAPDSVREAPEGIAFVVRARATDAAARIGGCARIAYATGEGKWTWPEAPARLAEIESEMRRRFPRSHVVAAMNAEKNPRDAARTRASRGGRLLRPDVNRSVTGFSPEDGSVRVGLGCVKDVGRKAEPWVEERRANGGYKGIRDFAVRTGCGAKDLKRLILAGAFDQWIGSREQAAADVDRLVNAVSALAALEKRLEELERKADPETSSGKALERAVKARDAQAEKVKEKRSELAAWRPFRGSERAGARAELERDLIGTPLSEGPLDAYRGAARGCVPLATAIPGERVAVIGSVRRVEEFQTRDGREAARITLEDPSGEMDLLFIGDDFREFRPLFAENVILKASVKCEGDKRRPGKTIGFGSWATAPEPTSPQWIAPATDRREAERKLKPELAKFATPAGGSEALVLDLETGELSRTGFGIREGADLAPLGAERLKRRIPKGKRK